MNKIDTVILSCFANRYLLSVMFLCCYANSSAQIKRTDSLIREVLAKVESLENYASKDTITIYNTVNNSPAVNSQLSLEKNMPWIVALSIGLLTLAANWIISYYSRSVSIRIANEQMLNASAITFRQFKATLNTKNRQDWIDRLRESISECLAVSAMISIELSAERANTERIKPYFERLVAHKSRIVLMLNESKAEQKVIRDNLELLMQEAMKSPGKFDFQKYTNIEKQIYSDSQKLFGIHWNKIKNIEDK